MLVIFTSSVLAFYGFIGIMTGADHPLENGPILIIRLVVLLAVVICGYQYQRLEQERRRAPTAVPAREAPLPAAEGAPATVASTPAETAI